MPRKRQTITEPQEFVFKPHPTQWEVYNDNHRFKVVSAGRRWGKTRLAWMELLEAALGKENGLYWWVASIYKELVPASQTIRETTHPDIISERSFERENILRYLRLYNGTEIYFHSANTEDSLRGSGLDGLVIDEGGSFPGQRYDEELRASLMDKEGWAMIIGTPKGRGFFYDMWLRGQDEVNFPEYKSWQYSSYENSTDRGGYLKRSEIDSIAKELPEIIFRQEILAQFLKGEGDVFRNVYGCIGGELGPPEPDKRYVIGADLGKTQDWTVLTAMDNTGLVRGFRRFKDLDWTIQEREIQNFQSIYNQYAPAPIVLDTGGPGNPVYDALFKNDVLIRGYKFTNESKRNLTENLSLCIDQGRVTIPGTSSNLGIIPDQSVKVLVDELEGFTYEILPSGNIRYEASKGKHDDCVVSLALAAWGIFSGGVTGGITASTGVRNRS